MLILDSNTISYYFRGDPHVVPRLQALRPVDLGVPAIVEYELRYGLLRMPQEAAAPRLAALAQLLRPMQLLAFDSECAAQANGLSKSRWVSEIIRKYAAHEWPQDCLAVAGRVADFPLREDSPAAPVADIPRLGF